MCIFADTILWLKDTPSNEYVALLFKTLFNLFL